MIFLFCFKIFVENIFLFFFVHIVVKINSFNFELEEKKMPEIVEKNVF